jgi:prepilin-type processing-associated H-X9-DG protein/prepilin-type N-terminal cleavage/methylation domain-containing protein
MLKPHAGVTLIELVVTLAIFVVLTAMLLPVLRMGRAQVWEGACLNNTRRMQVALVQWAQDHGGRCPAADTVWRAIDVRPGARVCPRAAALANGYVYSSLVAGKPLSQLAAPARELLFCDGRHDATLSSATSDNVAYSGKDLYFRHDGRLNAVFADGHVESLAGTRSLPLEFRLAPAAECTALDTATRGGWWSSSGGLVYGRKGYLLCRWNDNDVRWMPSGAYISGISAPGVTGGTWEGTPCSDPRALINPGNGEHAASYWTPAGPIGFTLANATDTGIHTAHLYLLDWDSQRRGVTLDVIGTATGSSVLKQPIPVANASGGVWVTVRFRGAVSLKLTTAAGAPVISAIAFD